MKSSLRLGIIGSSGGSAFAAADKCLFDSGVEIEWVIVTDRICGFETLAAEKKCSHSRIKYDNAVQFSKDACDIFEIEECNDVILFYTRRVSSPLIDRLRVWNIHPSLLPSFPGLNAVRDAFNAGVRILGGTLHRVDAGLDTGPIVAQVAAPLSSYMSLAEAEHLSYLQKVWLTLVWVDHLRSPGTLAEHTFLNVDGSTARPFLRNDQLYSSYESFLIQAK